jgi:hypothetical protein
MRTRRWALPLVIAVGAILVWWGWPEGARGPVELPWGGPGSATAEDRALQGGAPTPQVGAALDASPGLVGTPVPPSSPHARDGSPEAIVAAEAAVAASCGVRAIAATMRPEHHDMPSPDQPPPSRSDEVGSTSRVVRARPQPLERAHPLLLILRRGFVALAPTVFALVLAAALVLSPGWPGLVWWLLLTLLYAVAALTYGYFRWRALDRLWPCRLPVREPTRWQRTGLPVVAMLASGFVLMFLSFPTSSIGCGGYSPARYTFTVVDGQGLPIQGAQLSVLGPTRPARASDGCVEDKPDEPVGSWPIFEAGGAPLVTDQDGRLVVHQQKARVQFSTWSSTLFGFIVATSTTRPDHALEFRHAGHRTVVLDFAALNRRACERDAPRIERPDCLPLADIQVRVVMTAD